jgi:hypothetical protein
LLRFFDKIPTKNPILKSVTLSFIILLIVTMLIEVPAKFLVPTSDALRLFLVGTMFNVIRIPALGIVIGYQYKRLYEGFSPSVVASRTAKLDMNQGDKK